MGGAGGPGVAGGDMSPGKTWNMAKKWSAFVYRQTGSKQTAKRDLYMSAIKPKITRNGVAKKFHLQLALGIKAENQVSHLCFPDQTSGIISLAFCFIKI